MASLPTVMSSGVVMRMETSAYATTAVLCCLQQIWTPLSCCSSQQISGLTHNANNSILNGQPCLMEHSIGIGSDISPLIWTTDVAFAYMCHMLSTNLSLNPLLLRIVNRYTCDILSNRHVSNSTLL
jgi:hypothetical protein